VVVASAAEITLSDFPFHIHWDVYGVAAALVAGYWYALRRLAPHHAPASEPAASRSQVVSFHVGILLFVVVRGWPLHDIGEGSLFTFHMIEHLVLALGVPPLLLRGTPTWLMRTIVLPILPVMRVLTRPAVALVLFNVTLAVLHIPAVVELMLDSEPAHLLLHLLLMVTALLMWWPVIGPVPEIPKLSPFAAMGYVFLQSLVPTVPASFLTFADVPIYRVYEELPRLWGVDVLTDQLIAGLIMKIGGGLVLWTVITVIFFGWALEEERSAAASYPRARSTR
jgi:putative membrane protein